MHETVAEQRHIDMATRCAMEAGYWATQPAQGGSWASSVNFTYHEDEHGARGDVSYNTSVVEEEAPQLAKAQVQLPYVKVLIPHPFAKTKGFIIPVLWDTGCNRPFMSLAVFFRLYEMGLIIDSWKYAHPRKISGSCGGNAHIMGWAIMGICFGTSTIPYCFHLVDNLGCDIMWGHRAMTLMGTILDHGRSSICARYLRFGYHDRDKNREDMPVVTVGYSSDGLAMESEEPVPLCRFFHSYREAWNADMTFSPELKQFMEPVSGAYHQKQFSMLTVGQV